MTTISNSLAPAQLHASTTPTGAAPEDRAHGLSLGAKVAIGGGVAVLGAAAAVGVHLLTHRSGGPSRVIGVIDGVELLSNPLLAKGDKYAWGVPKGTLFGSDPAVSIEHVDQGALGDCWNVAAMGAIAYKEPQAITNAVREASSGKHMLVTLGDRTIAIDKKLPIRPKDGGPAYAGRLQDDPVLWPAYIEKAEAAVNPKGYRGLVGNNGREGFRRILGADPQPRASSGSTAQDIATAFRTNRPTVVGVGHDIEDINVHGSHEYIVHDVVGEGRDISITLFNPWGDTHPTRPLREADLGGINEVATPDYWI